MKPPPFDYSAPRSVAEALELLQQAPDETSALAGGQSLVPVLNMRLAQPRALVDLNRVEGLDGIETTPEGRIVLRENGGAFALSDRGWQRMVNPPPLDDVRLRLKRSRV